MSRAVGLRLPHYDLMELVVVLISLFKLGSALVKNDGSQAESAIEKLVEMFLSHLLSGQTAADAKLQRIEAGLNRLEAKPFEANKSVGLVYLRDAAAQGRRRIDQDHLLWLALEAFRLAVANALNVEQKVEALVLVACCWVARGSAVDASQALVDARDAAFAEALRQAKDYGLPEGVRELYEKELSQFGRLVAYLDDGPGSKDRTKFARAQLRSRARTARDRAVALFNQLQDAREIYGAEPADCARIAGFWEPGYTSLSPKFEGPNLESRTRLNNHPVLGWEEGHPIELHGVRVTATIDGEPSTRPDVVTVEVSAILTGRQTVELDAAAGWPSEALYYPGNGSVKLTLNADRRLKLRLPILSKPPRFVLNQYWGELDTLIAAFDIIPRRT